MFLTIYGSVRAVLEELAFILLPLRLDEGFGHNHIADKSGFTLETYHVSLTSRSYC